MLPELTLFENAAAAKLEIKKNSAMTTNKKSASRNLLLVALIYGIIVKSDCYSFLSLMIFKVLAIYCW